MQARKKSNIVVVTGAYPDVGKGIFTSSLGYLFQESGYSVSPIKFDGYINTSSGSMNPYHGNIVSKYSKEEVFVLEDGYEADADSGYYERFLDASFTNLSNITNGRLFSKVLTLEKERKLRQGEVINYRYIRSFLSEWILKISQSADIVLLEVGGTIGDKETEIVFDVINLIRSKKLSNIYNIMLSPYFKHESGEGLELSYRSKITRQAFEKSWRLGMMPHAIVLRSENKNELRTNDFAYISLETGIESENIYIDSNCQSIYELPQILNSQKIEKNILKELNLKPRASKKSRRLEQYVKKLQSMSTAKTPPIHLGIFGKSVSHDTFVSLIEAIEHSSVFLNKKIVIEWLDDDSNYLKTLEKIDALIIGEGLNQSKEKISCLSYARKNNLPCLAFSFGLDLMIKEYIEDQLRMPVLIEELKNKNGLKIEKKELITGAIELVVKGSRHYSPTKFRERIRSYSSLNKDLSNTLNSSDLQVTATQKLTQEPVIVELKQHTFYVGVRFHPEFLSRPLKPHPLIVKLLKQALK